MEILNKVFKVVGCVVVVIACFLFFIFLTSLFLTSIFIVTDFLLGR